MATKIRILRPQNEPRFGLVRDVCPDCGEAVSETSEGGRKVRKCACGWVDSINQLRFLLKKKRIRETTSKLLGRNKL